jgi:hypothetical protein
MATKFKRDFGAAPKFTFRLTGERAESEPQFEKTFEHLLSDGAAQTT